MFPFTVHSVLHLDESVGRQGGREGRNGVIVMVQRHFVLHRLDSFQSLRTDATLLNSLMWSRTGTPC